MPTIATQKETSTGKIQDYLKLEIEYQITTLKQIFEQCIVAQFQIIADKMSTDTAEKVLNVQRIKRFMAACE